MRCSHNVFKGNLGFYQVTVGAQGVGAGFVFGLAKGGEHDDLNIFEAVGITQDIEHLKTANAWHHDIRNNEVWLLFFGDDQRVFAVHGRYDRVAFCHEAGFIYFPQVIVIFNQQNLWHLYYSCCYLVKLMVILIVS